ncbi:polysaccharide deacetylase family protein [Allosphingosinicella deserti]|uniref:Chitooligosaccharide deacetylase n=1 Tax=Allosphingosinicella deserti TaxID=2116704 RepID=A0A2P7QRG6_9SPHN|nr:hypothetical protein C7I55_09415 [Sphingomonas deserti]
MDVWKLVAGMCAALQATPASAQSPPEQTPAPPSVSARTSVRSVALTYDDLPFVSSSNEEPRVAGKKALHASRQIQRSLLSRHAPATGFVNEIKLRDFGEHGLTILRDWNRGEFELANHSFSHADSNNLSLGEIEQEVVQGQRASKALAQAEGRSLRFFRFPYNHVGDTEEKRVAIEQLLAGHGYRMAASTIDTSDFLFNKAYERACAEKDRPMRRRIEQAYLDHTRQQIQYYSALNERISGYRPPDIIVLHLNSLNAAVNDRILEIFEELEYRFVSLAEAQSDPAYQRSPAVATRFGPMWAYRWARERGIKVDGSLEKEPPDWVSAYAALDLRASTPRQ